MQEISSMCFKGRQMQMLKSLIKMSDLVSKTNSNSEKADIKTVLC